jgi:type II secretory pathway pseudopilin PulG
MSARGLTLLETLIALALVLALAAIVVPPALEAIEQREFDTAAEMTVEHLLAGRAAARQSAHPVEVAYLPQRRCLVARPFMLDAGAEPGADGAAAPAPEDGATESPAGIVDPSTEVTILPGTARLSAAAPPGRVDPLAALPANEAAPEDEPDEPITVVVYLPDGAALYARPLWLVDDGGRAGRVTVSAVTGVPRFLEGGPDAEDPGGAP